MTILTGIRTGLRLASRIDRKYNLNKIFVEKYVPPGYRKLVNRFFDIGLTLSGGYGIYNALIAPDTPGNSAPIFQQKKQFTPRKPYQTRVRRTGSNRIRCPEQYKPDYNKRRSSYRRYK